MLWVATSGATSICFLSPLLMATNRYDVHGIYEINGRASVSVLGYVDEIAHFGGRLMPSPFIIIRFGNGKLPQPSPWEADNYCGRIRDQSLTEKAKSSQEILMILQLSGPENGIRLWAWSLIA
jgi:hypothetical protein